jgi:hypothetical protein
MLLFYIFVPFTPRPLTSSVPNIFFVCSIVLRVPIRGGTPCGIKPVKDVPGVENYDVTSLVESHTKYADAIPTILQHIRFSEP